jgi:hypothetical protein
MDTGINAGPEDRDNVLVVQKRRCLSLDLKAAATA